MKHINIRQLQYLNKICMFLKSIAKKIIKIKNIKRRTDERLISYVCGCGVSVKGGAALLSNSKMPSI